MSFKNKDNVNPFVKFLEQMVRVVVIGIGFVLFFFLAKKIISLQGGNLLFFVFMIPAMGMGLLLADFFSGLAHYLLDNFGTPETPLFGNLIYLFRDHHVNPDYILEVDFFENNFGTFSATLPVCVLLVLLPVSLDSPLSLFLYQWFFWGLFFIAFTNEFHKLAHSKKPKFFPFALLQKYKVILHPDDHNVHHTTHDRYYCITTGWLNYITDKTQFFEKLIRKKK